MADSDGLVKALKGLLKVAVADLTAQAEAGDAEWARQLRAEYDRAFAKGRTGQSWSAWRASEVDQAGVSWVLSSVFVRFCEDNGLVDGVWITGPGERGQFALDAEAVFYRQDPSRNARDWLRQGFGVLADLPATSDVVSREHSPVWRVPLGADASKQILDFWRDTRDDGSLKWSLADPDLGTRFLGDIYQDLSEAAKKQYALLQTPVFVEEFILDQTLDPAIAEFGLSEVKMIDPACGSGHFLLGAFARLLDGWTAQAPGMDVRERVQRALDQVHGVDLNPFAVAIARFRLTVAAVNASGLHRLSEAPRYNYHLASGDSLLAGLGRQGVLLDDDGDLADHAYPAEDVHEHPGILEPGRYQVVVGNPPYIQVADPGLNAAYRAAYRFCQREYQLTVPFAELMFRLAVPGTSQTPGGFVGQITGNGFMKREFGKRLVEDFLSGSDPSVEVDLNTLIDTSGAFIPGHGTPTVILIGRRRRASGGVRAVLGLRGEPGQPSDPVRGLVWSEISEHFSDPGFEGTYVSVVDLDREVLGRHPWSLSGGEAPALKAKLDTEPSRLREAAYEIGYTGQTNADDAFLAPESAFVRHRVEDNAHRQVVIGEVVRDFVISPSDHGIFPYGPGGLLAIEDVPGVSRWLWPLRSITWSRATFGKKTYRAEGKAWWEWHQVALRRLRSPLSISFAFVATHNHFVLDRGGKVFNRSAPVIKLPEGATEDDHLGLLAVLNSSTACFWLKQVCHNKGRPGAEAAGADEPWEHRFEFTGTKLEDYPLPSALPVEFGRRLDQFTQRLHACAPAEVCRAGKPARDRLDASRNEYEQIRGEMIAIQEELDWHVYYLYGLTDEPLTYGESDLPALSPSERAFAISLASQLEAGAISTTWFTHHNHRFEPMTEVSESWPAEYRELVQRRLDLMASDRSIGLLERPEFKRRWAAKSWEDMETEALRDYCLDRLEDPSWWSDAQGPRVLSVSQLTQVVRHDERLIAGLEALTGTADFDLPAEIGRLVSPQAVPFLAAHRYADAGLVKRKEWEHVWDLQRREDAGETVDIPVPPKYQQKDFRKATYWKARGKLDVPKERFIAYPGAGAGADTSLVVGWAGWDHAQQAFALARLIVDRQNNHAWGAEELTPLLAGLAELESWLWQWHNGVDAATGVNPAQAITALLDQQLAQHRVTRVDLGEWRPG
jgi:hypothetical protein